MEDQYNTECSNCPRILDIDCPIHIMTYMNIEKVICDDCYQTSNWSNWKSDD